ncbi:MAG: hypothetical protein Q9207_001028 [Kuettlingeria erythrocarpa]
MSSLGSSDAVLAMHDAETAMVKYTNDEVLHLMQLDGMRGQTMSPGEFNRRLNKETLTAEDIMMMYQRRARQADLAGAYALDALLYGGAAFTQLASIDPLSLSVNQGRLQNALNPPDTPHRCSLAITAERFHGPEGLRHRVQAFQDSLPSPAWSPAIRPTEIFPTPAAEAPVSEPAKSGVTGRRSKEQIPTQVFPIPSPVTPLPDPLKGGATEEGEPVRPRRTGSPFRRVGHLDNKSGRSVAPVEQYIENKGSSDTEDEDYKRCELCVHY